MQIVGINRKYCSKLISVACQTEDKLLPPPQASLIFLFAHRPIERPGVSKRARTGAGSERGARAQRAPSHDSLGRPSIVF